MTTRANARGSRYSRASFLRRVGIGAAAMGAGGVLGGRGAPAEAAAGHYLTTQPPDRFGRMFHGLPPFAPAGPGLEEALRDLGRPGGILDANDALERGPVKLITDPALSANNPNNPDHTAGTTFVGQFLDHDITFDVGSRLGRATPPHAAVNARTPAFDLDSVYGAGPVASPQLYDPADRAKLRIESGGAFEDLPRAADGSAIIGDPRNDEHVVIAGLQCAFILFHNHAVDLVRSSGAADAFAEARRLVTWHYHWLILH
jgi:hypothetical protein